MTNIIDYHKILTYFVALLILAVEYMLGSKLLGEYYAIQIPTIRCHRCSCDHRLSAFFRFRTSARRDT